MKFIISRLDLLFQLRELLDKIQQLPHELSGGFSSHQNRQPALNTHNINPTMQRPQSPTECATSRMRRARGKMYMPLGQPVTRNKAKRWMSRSAPTTPSGTIPMMLLPGQSMRPSDTDNYSHQAVPLLSEQDENDNARGVSRFLTEHEEESQQL